MYNEGVLHPSTTQGTDKEYHLRVARVNELRMEQENLNTEQKTERGELAQLVQRHHSNLNATIDKRYVTPSCCVYLIELKKVHISLSV